MPSTSAIVAKQIGDLKAQSLSTLMATIDPVQGAARVVSNLTGNAEATMQSAEAAIRAIVIENSGNGRAILQVAGGLVEAELPAELMRASLTNPNLLKPGATLTLPADIPARPVSQPATLVAISGQATGASVGPAPPLANAFPPGTFGALISRLAGIAFPGSEPEALAMPGTSGHQPVLRPGILSQPLSPDLAEALLRAASRQMPLSGALTQILTLGEADIAHLPPDLAAAIRAVQAARTTPDALKTPDGLQNAVQRSGLFLEANLAQAGGLPAQGDLKTALLALKALMAGEAPALQSAAARLATPNAARLPGEADHARPDMVRAVEGAVERLKLLQMASLPEHPEIRVTDDRAQPMRLALQIPLATQGPDRPPTAMMGLMIEHRPQASEVTPYEIEKDCNGETEAFPWKVRIALDLEETGPVQAEIALRGQSVAVTLWAERQSMAALARDEIGALHEALTGAAFDVFKLEVKDGRPQGKVPRAGPLLDRRT